MNKSTAIKILMNQRDELKRLKNKDNQFDLWAIQTEYYIKTFFHDYSLHGFIIKNSPTPNISHDDTVVDGYIMRMTKFLDNCIATIQDVDIKNPEGRNYLYRLDNTWLTTILGIALTVVFSGGLIVGRYADNRSYNIELKGDGIRNNITLPAQSSTIPYCGNDKGSKDSVKEGK